MRPIYLLTAVYCCCLVQNSQCAHFDLPCQPPATGHIFPTHAAHALLLCLHNPHTSATNRSHPPPFPKTPTPIHPAPPPPRHLTLRLSFMLRATAACSVVKGLVVPRSSDTVVAAALGAAAGAAALAAAGAAAAGAAAAGAAPPLAARSTSLAVIRPLGPVPPTVARSTRRSFASCFA